jgi:hypothetical protein
MKPTEKQIKSEIKKLRKLIDESKNPIIIRIAYSMENTLGWATEDTVGWKKPSEDALDEAFLLGKEIEDK